MPVHLPVLYVFDEHSVLLTLACFRRDFYLVCRGAVEEQAEGEVEVLAPFLLSRFPGLALI